MSAGYGAGGARRFARPWGSSRSAGVRRAVLVAAVGFGLVAVVPAPAVAAEPGWWYEQMGVRQAHAAGFTGKGVKIAVLDSSINLGAPSLRGANIRVADPVCVKDSQTREYFPTTSDQYLRPVRHGVDVVAQIVGQDTGGGRGGGVAGIAPD
ncbi:MAG: S8 family serine peptidase, partial [Micrococcales bacterium]|nr:S8 family serine peptidase [Micrococcales bacterium]